MFMLLKTKKWWDLKTLRKKLSRVFLWFTLCKKLLPWPFMTALESRLKKCSETSKWCDTTLRTHETTTKTTIPHVNSTSGKKSATFCLQFFKVCIFRLDTMHNLQIIVYWQFVLRCEKRTSVPSTRDLHLPRGRKYDSRALKWRTVCAILRYIGYHFNFLVWVSGRVKPVS